ncbi:hypothetical protein [Bradyrhizobium sp. USDA 4353]
MTTGRELIPWGAVIAADVMSTFSIPGGNSLGKFADEYLQKRRNEAAEILIEEVARGRSGPIEFSESDADPLIAIIYRFSKAVADGAARENLRLLAQIIVGLKKNKALDPDKFRKWANTLEQLTRDELIVLGKAIAVKRKMVDVGSDATNDFWQALKSSLESGGYPAAEIDALCASVSRYGLLVPVSAWGGLVYMPSPWLDELGDLADVEGVAVSNQ